MVFKEEDFEAKSSAENMVYISQLVCSACDKTDSAVLDVILGENIYFTLGWTEISFLQRLAIFFIYSSMRDSGWVMLDLLLASALVFRSPVLVGLSWLSTQATS